MTITGFCLTGVACITENQGPNWTLPLPEPEKKKFCPDRQQLFDLDVGTCAGDLRVHCVYGGYNLPCALYAH
jgi:hypothetical protein